MCKCELKTYPVGTILYRCHQTSTFGNFEEKTTSDWSNAIYFFTKETDLSFYDEEAHPHKMYLTLQRELRYIECTHSCFKDGTYSNEMPAIRMKIAKLLEQTTVPAEGLFMKWLGELECAFQCYHSTNGSIEVAIPISWLKIEGYSKATFPPTE